MKFALLTTLFILGVTATAQARLGENADQLVARYGDPLKETDQKNEGIKVAAADVNFQKGGIQITVKLVNGVSASESFKKLNGQGFSIGEVRTLLAANSEGHEWQAPVVVNAEKIWLRDDSASARLNAAGTVLLIKSRALANAETQARQFEKNPSLEGF